MSASDDTQKKLIDSIRKTRQASASGKAASSKSGRGSGKAAARGKASSTAGTAAGGVSEDAYQAGRRIWPD